MTWLGQSKTKQITVYLGESLRRQWVDNNVWCAVVDIGQSYRYLYAWSKTCNSGQVESVARYDHQRILAVLFVVDSSAHQQFAARTVHSKQWSIHRLQPTWQPVTTSVKKVMFSSVCWSVCLSAGLLKNVMDEFSWNFWKEYTLGDLSVCDVCKGHKVGPKSVEWRYSYELIF